MLLPMQHQSTSQPVPTPHQSKLPVQFQRIRMFSHTDRYQNLPEALRTFRRTMGRPIPVEINQINQVNTPCKYSPPTFGQAGPFLPLPGPFLPSSLICANTSAAGPLKRAARPREGRTQSPRVTRVASSAYVFCEKTRSPR